MFRITMDELKKLARVWKLNERRNFWKQHFTREALLGALLQHIRDTNSSFAAQGLAQSQQDEPQLLPVPPTEAKPSFSGPEVKLKFKKFRKICGYPVLNPIRGERDIITQSRLKEFPKADTVLTAVINTWRVDDLNARPATVPKPDSDGNNGASAKPMSSIIRAEKQRSLALQLLDFTLKSRKRPLSKQQVETFLVVSETEDYETAEYCAAAISNICSKAETRSLLIELNAIHKYSALLSHLKTPAAAWAATLFFYYLSCETDIEDRVYNAGFNTLFVNASGSDLSLCAASMTGLSNLLPCSERQRVAELIVKSAMRFGNGYFAAHQEETRTVLTAIQKAASFTNVHTTLLNMDLMDFTALVVPAQDRSLTSIGRILSSTLSAFLHSPDVYEDIIQSDYVHIFIDLLSFDDDAIVAECIKALTVLSGNPESVLAVMEKDVVQIVCGLATFRDLTKEMALDTAKYFANICRPGSALTQAVIDAGVHGAVLLLLERHYDDSIRLFSLRALRGILSEEAHCSLFCDLSIKPLLAAIQNKEEPEAITCLQHISVVPHCIPALFKADVHVHILAILHSSKLQSLSAAAVVGYLRILLQLAAGSAQRCVALVQLRAVEGLLFILKEGEEVQKTPLPPSPGRRSIYLNAPKDDNKPAKKLFLRENVDVCKVLSRLLVCLITGVGGGDGSVLTASIRAASLDIVQLISRPGAAATVFDECSLVLASISGSGVSFDVVHPIIVKLLGASNSDSMLESMAVVLYNMACDPKNIKGMIADTYYINVMIRMMRSGILVAQDCIVDTFKVLCCYPECCELLVKHDLLSDFIVIALLRTSSERIKTVCSEALYNMLCQSSQLRLRLMDGDLWWAVMRLTKTDIERIREVCCSAILNLSMEPENIPSLRRHHVISFLKEFTAAGRGPFLEPCFIVLENILNSAAADLHHPELDMTAILCSSCLTRCDTDLSVTLALSIISRTLVILSERNMGIVDFSNADFAKTLLECKSFWQSNARCRETISFILQTACRHAAFIAATPLSDVVPICAILLYGPNKAHMYRQSSMVNPSVAIMHDPFADALDVSVSIIERENVALVFMSYLSRMTAQTAHYAKQMIKSGIFHSCVSGPLCSSQRSSIVSRLPTFAMPSEQSDVGAIDPQGQGGAAPDALVQPNRDANKTPASGKFLVVSRELRLTSLAAYAFALPMMVHDAELKVKEEAELRSYMSSRNTASNLGSSRMFADVFDGAADDGGASTNSWYGVLPIDLLAVYLWDSESLANASFIIAIYARYQILAGFLLDANVFTFLNSMLEIALDDEASSDNTALLSAAFSVSKRSSASEAAGSAADIAAVWEDVVPASIVAARFCSSVMRTISSHPHLMPQLIGSKDLDRVLYLLSGVQDQVVARDMCIFMYRVAHEELTKDTVLSPKVLLDIAQIEMKHSFDESLQRLFRHISAIVLENFSQELGSNPDSVRSVFSEMMENDGYDVTHLFSEWSFDDRALGLRSFERQNPSPHPREDIMLPAFPPVAELWLLIRNFSFRQLDSIMFSANANVSGNSDKEEDFFTVLEYPIEKEAPAPLIPYAKIVCTYPLVDTSPGTEVPTSPSKRASLSKMNSHFDPFASMQSMSSSIGDTLNEINLSESFYGVEASPKGSLKKGHSKRG